MPTTTYSALQLKANPFSPELTLNGQSITFDYTQGPLVPQQNLIPLDYYYDLYIWSDPDQIGQIRQDGRFVAFPDHFGQPGMIIIISGRTGTGRTSLENLLLFEVATRANIAAVITRYTIEVISNKVQAAQNFASSFIQDINDYLTELKRGKEAKTLSKKLKETLKDWRENLVQGEANTEFLFQQLTREVRKKSTANPNCILSRRLKSHEYTTFLAPSLHYVAQHRRFCGLNAHQAR